MRRLAFRFALAAAAALTGASAHAGAKLDGNDRDILRHDFASGGQPLASAGLKLNGRLGTVGTTEFAGGALKVRSGLMRILPQPGTITQLQLVTKSTGTLDLAWTAPGLDGYRGNVTGGRYRIDYSSETGHLFSPTTYQIELATNVVVGATESYQLTGLSPNSTYFVKIYLAGPDRFYAEDSKRLDEPTLANVPVNPFFSMVGQSSVTISWLIPVGGAAGYDLQGASTTLGLSLGGGSVTSSQTANGQLLSLTLEGLRNGTTYFFKVASLNWESERTFTTVISTLTRLGSDPLPVENLAAFTDDRGRRVGLTWTVPPFLGQQGVLVLLSTSPAAFPVVDGTGLAPGQTLTDASVVRSTQLAAAYNDPGPLQLDTTLYYHLYTYGDAVAPFTYSVVVSTQVFLDLPPNAPAGLSSFLSPDRKQFAISWNPVVSNDDGTLFASTSTPKTVEVTRYDVFRSTSVERGGWTRVSSSPVSGNFFTETIPDPNQTFFYRVASVDSFERSQRSLVIDTQGEFYVLSPDDISRFRFTSALSKELLSGGNKYASDLTIRASTLSATGQDRVFKATEFDVVKLPGNEPVKDFTFSQANAELALHYDVVNGFVVPSDAAAALASGGAAPTGEPLGGTIRAGEADRQLGMYWNNGQKFVKLFGRVDTGAQLVRIQTSMPGTYQVRGLTRQSAFDFDLSGISNKAITPNGDGRNDQVIFTFDNPRDSLISGEVFDVNGARIAAMTPGPLGNTLKWDGTANGRAVPSGVYVYQIRGEAKTFNGTVVVIR
ncbi:MAG: fibronectin type III domain-containing protein [Elusimicrobia bacterium]|nr:fibronectin type III domain-containing protein [Elusimicrobiota bacterium]